MSANVVSLAVSVVTTLLVPKFIGVDEFGHFQLYIFYSSYVGLLHLGWNDGILLRYGGKRFQDLDKSKLYSQFVMLVLLQVLVGALIFLGSLTVSTDRDVVFISKAIALCTLLTSPQFMLLFLLQATLRIEQYARVVVVQRLFYVIFVVAALLAGSFGYELLVAADLVSRLGGLLLAIYFCREIVLQSPLKFRFSFPEAALNVRAGWPLMVGAAAGALVIGVVRLGIAGEWDVAVFGKVSLALSLANMALTTIVAAGTVAFPMLRRLPEERLPAIYTHSRLLLTAGSLAALLLYHPLRLLVTAWLPEYIDSAAYLGMLFPVLVYQVRTSLLVETYLKVRRMETVLFGVNLGSLVLAVFVTIITVSWLGNLDMAVLSIPFVAGIRSVALECALVAYLGRRFVGELALEAALVASFVITAVYWTWSLSGLVYVFVGAACLFLLRRQLRAAVAYLM